MILTGQVCQLVGDVTLSERWEKHGCAPVDAERSIGRATTPALAFISYKHLRPFSLPEPRPPPLNKIRQPLGSPVAKPTVEGVGALLTILVF